MLQNYSPSMTLFLSCFMTAPPTLLPKQMQASHLCTLPAVNTNTQKNLLTYANTFPLPLRLRVPCERLHQQQWGPLAVATVENIPVAPSGLCQPAPPALTTQRAGTTQPDAFHRCRQKTGGGGREALPSNDSLRSSCRAAPD